MLTPISQTFEIIISMLTQIVLMSLALNKIRHRIQVGDQLDSLQKKVTYKKEALNIMINKKASLRSPHQSLRDNTTYISWIQLNSISTDLSIMCRKTMSITCEMAGLITTKIFSTVLINITYPTTNQCRRPSHLHQDLMNQVLRPFPIMTPPVVVIVMRDKARCL